MDCFASALRHGVAFCYPIFFGEVAFEYFVHEYDFRIRHSRQQIREKLHGFLRVILGSCGNNLTDLLPFALLT